MAIGGVCDVGNVWHVGGGGAGIVTRMGRHKSQEDKTHKLARMHCGIKSFGRGSTEHSL